MHFYHPLPISVNDKFKINKFNLNIFGKMLIYHFLISGMPLKYIPNQAILLCLKGNKKISSINKKIIIHFFTRYGSKINEYI